MGAFAVLGMILFSGHHPPFEWLGFTLCVLVCCFIEWSQHSPDTPGDAADARRDLGLIERLRRGSQRGAGRPGRP